MDERDVGRCAEEQRRRYALEYERRVRNHQRLRVLWLATLAVLTVVAIVLWVKA